MCVAHSPRFAILGAAVFARFLQQLEDKCYAVQAWTWTGRCRLQTFWSLQWGTGARQALLVMGSVLVNLWVCAGILQLTMTTIDKGC